MYLLNTLFVYNVTNQTRQKMNETSYTDQALSFIINKKTPTNKEAGLTKEIFYTGLRQGLSTENM